MVLSSTTNSSGVLTLSTGAVTKQELFRFETHDLRNEQWSIKTWDEKHLSVNKYGQLTAKVNSIKITAISII
jgi:hypothetical protein